MINETQKRDIEETVKSVTLNPPKGQATSDSSITMDEEDKLRVENIMLKEELEKTYTQLEDMRRQMAQQGISGQKSNLQKLLKEKYEIGSEEYLSLDAQAGIITVKSNVETNDQRNTEESN